MSERWLYTDVADSSTPRPTLVVMGDSVDVLEFFDKYLRNRAETPLLNGERSYVEAELVRKSEVRQAMP